VLKVTRKKVYFNISKALRKIPVQVSNFKNVLEGQKIDIVCPEFLMMFEAISALK